MFDEVVFSSVLAERVAEINGAPARIALQKAKRAALQKSGRRNLKKSVRLTFWNRHLGLSIAER
jgi:hypothetical protein